MNIHLRKFSTLIFLFNQNFSYLFIVNPNKSIIFAAGFYRLKPFQRSDARGDVN